MDRDQRMQLNNFFVDTFNLILVGEERALQRAGINDLSMREMHVISVVASLNAHEQNTMSRIAEKLFISAGALTTAINILIKKGYVQRERSALDRRKVLVSLTPKAEKVLHKHDEFHDLLINHVAASLSKNELKLLTESLKRVRDLTHSFVYEEEEKE